MTSEWQDVDGYVKVKLIPLMVISGNMPLENITVLEKTPK